jgi:hypothetical protein
MNCWLVAFKRVWFYVRLEDGVLSQRNVLYRCLYLTNWSCLTVGISMVLSIKDLVEFLDLP